MINRRLLTEYFLMVGVPVILLLAVLHVGRSLRAAPELRGVWKFDFTGSAETGSCGPTVSDVAGFVMSISQSGTYLNGTVLNPWQPVLRGRSEGSELWFESVPVRGPRPSSDLLRLTGTVRNAEDGKLIRGTLLMPRRVDCPPLGFEARPQPRQDRKR